LPGTSFSDTALTSVRQPFLPAAELEPLLDQLRATNVGAGYLRCELARFLNVDDDWTTVTAARNAAAEADYHAWTAHLFDEAKHRGAAGRRRRCAAAYRR